MTKVRWRRSATSTESGVPDGVAARAGIRSPSCLPLQQRDQRHSNEVPEGKMLEDKEPGNVSVTSYGLGSTQQSSCPAAEAQFNALKAECTDGMSLCVQPRMISTETHD
jgi:hypothetical protein